MNDKCMLCELSSKIEATAAQKIQYDNCQLTPEKHLSRKWDLMRQTWGHFIWHDISSLFVIKKMYVRLNITLEHYDIKTEK